MAENPYKDANRYGKDYINSLFTEQRTLSAKAGGYYCGALVGAGLCLHGLVGAVSAMRHKDKSKEVDWKSVALRAGEAAVGGITFVASLSRAQGIFRAR